MQTLELFLSIVFLYSACNILQMATSDEQQIPKSDTAIAQVSDSGTNDSVVYTYSEAIVRDGKPMVSQLTIAKGKDGKNHYARTENGTYKTGVWEGPLPKSPDVSQLVGDMHEITKQLENPLAELNLGIGNTLQDYLQKAFIV